MKKGYTHVSILADRSGSMQPIIEEMRTTLTNIISSQKEIPGEATLTLVIFDSEYEKLCDFLDIKKEVPNLDGYTARGMTALVDSFCKLIDETGEKLSKMDEKDRPEKVLFMCITDGEENASKQYKNQDLKERIELQSGTYKWTFSYIGANQDSFANAGNYGIQGDAVMNFAATRSGVQGMAGSIGTAFVSYMSSTAEEAVFNLPDESDDAEV